MHHHHHLVLRPPAPPPLRRDRRRARDGVPVRLHGDGGHAGHDQPPQEGPALRDRRAAPHARRLLHRGADRSNTTIHSFRRRRLHREVPIDPIRRFIRSVVVVFFTEACGVCTIHGTQRESSFSRKNVTIALGSRARRSSLLWRPLLRATVQRQWRCDSFVRPTSNRDDVDTKKEPRRTVSRPLLSRRPPRWPPRNTSMTHTRKAAHAHRSEAACVRVAEGAAAARARSTRSRRTRPARTARAPA